MKVRDILFDLGKVLVPFDWGIAIGRLEPHLPDEVARLSRHDRSAFERLFHKPAAELEMGQIDFARFHEIMMERLGVAIDPREFRDIWCNIFTLDERMADLAESLATEYGVWLVSNTSRAHWRHIIAKWPRLSFFKGAALSFELHCMKPAPEYYRKAIEMFRIDPAASVFIDDIQENVDAAARTGMIGILYRGRERLLRELHDLGVYEPGYSR